MQRRELIQLIVALTACPFMGRDELFAGPDSDLPSPYSEDQIAFFDEVAECILPRTDSPGARDAGVGPFIARYSGGCYTTEQIELLKGGISDIEARMRKRNGQGFRAALSSEQAALLTEIDRQAKKHARAVKDKDSALPHYFTLMKQLTLLGFFTSEQGATQVCRYRPIPGRYKGCIPYKGETFWAW
jgi:hypothetical protein